VKPARTFDHEFVEHIPEELEDGTIYISMPFATATHRCACGCGQEVVTPFSRTDWEMTFDGETVSLSPSIGNWNFACQSHYWIERGQVCWARPWSREEIDRGRARDRRMKEHHRRLETTEAQGDTPAAEPTFLGRLLESLRWRGR
jgi:hypothetical protein